MITRGKYGRFPPEYAAYRASLALGGGSVAPWQWSDRDDWWQEWVLLFADVERQAADDAAQREAGRQQLRGGG